MRNLPRPARDQVREQLNNALEVQERNGNIRGYPASTAEFEAIIALYDAYDSVDGAPNEHLKGAHLDEALRVTIQDSYDLTQRGRRLASIRAALMQGIEHCPICGISPPRVLDHHLPKSRFLPFAIYVGNLIPLCVDCNSSKGATISADPAKRFVHPYFEPLPHVRFLCAKVTTENGGLVSEFGVNPAADLPDLLKKRLDYQIHRLRLNERYAQEINTYLVSHATALHMCFEAIGAEGVRKFLHTQAEIEFDRFHLNHWRPALLQALENHEEFCKGKFIDLLPMVPAEELPIAPEVSA